MAVLDAAISHPRQIRGSSPRMTNYKTVMAVLDTAIFFHAADARIKSAHDDFHATENVPLDNIPICVYIVTICS